MEITKHPITGALLDELVLGKAVVVAYFSGIDGQEGILINRGFSIRQDGYMYALYETYNSSMYFLTVQYGYCEKHEAVKKAYKAFYNLD